MPKNLDDRIKERQIEAISKGLFEKVEYICKHLGEKTKTNTLDGGEVFLDHTYYRIKTPSGTKLEYTKHHFFSEGNKRVKVEDPSGGELLLQHWDKEKGYEIEGVWSYIPGNWEKELDPLLKEAKEKFGKNAAKAAETLKKNKDLAIKEKAEKFGL